MVVLERPRIMIKLSKVRRREVLIREYKSSDCEALIQLFTDTVNTINSKDYDEEQLNAWTDSADLEEWDKSLRNHYSLVACKNNKIIGFGDIDKTGYLDRLYVHKDFQRKGIAAALCNELEQSVDGSIITHASVTAKPFFEKRGYKVLKKQQVNRKGVLLTNYIMKK